MAAEFIFIALVLTTFMTFDRVSLVYLLPPAVDFELIAIYFFRVVLMHFRSVKAQLLQLDLRIALCQFIENYT